MTDPTTRCSVEVREPGVWPRYHQCKRKATVQDGGKLFCTTHSPAKVTERKAKAEAKWRERNEFERGKYEAPRLRAELTEAIRQRDEAIRDWRETAIERNEAQMQRDDAVRLLRGLVEELESICTCNASMAEEVLEGTDVRPWECECPEPWAQNHIDKARAFLANFKEDSR